MTTLKFKKQFIKQCRNLINISAEPIFGEYIINQNGKRIGVLFHNKLYLLSTQNLKKMLPNAVEENPFDWAYYRLILIDNIEETELLEEAITTVYHDLYFDKEFVTDISSLFKAYRGYSNSILDIYTIHVTFLRFCYAEGLLKINPLDKMDRIIHLNFENNDLTEKGIEIFEDLYSKWLGYTDKTDERSLKRNTNIKMLEKYYTNLLAKKTTHNEN